MKNFTRFLFASLGLATAMTACTPNISPDVISSEQANQSNNTLPGKIINTRVVEVTGNSNKIGMIAGGAAGAIAGSAIGGGDRVPLLTGIGGALLGGAAGDYAQDKLSKQQGMEYTVKVGKRHFLTVVQSLTPAYNVGQCVFVIQGQYARITNAASDDSVCDGL